MFWLIQHSVLTYQMLVGAGLLQLVRSAYQPPASSTFLSEQTSHQQPANSTFLSQQTSTSHQPNEQALDLKSCCAFASQVHITCTVVHFMTGARLENSSVCLCCVLSAERRQI
jgi:hypothetical protein